MIDRYIPNDRNEPVPCADLLAWGKWLQSGNDRKRVAETTVEVGGKKYWVSTVFLGLDHRFGSDGPPIVFETMVFDHTIGESFSDLASDRYCTWDEAMKGHEKIVAGVRDGSLIGGAA